MRYENLPELLSDNETPNVVKITNRKIDPNAKEGTIIQFPAERIAYPVAETEEEMYQLCGGKENVLKVFNGHLRDEAVTEVKNSIRVASTGSVDDIIDAGLARGKSFTFVEAVTVSAAEAKAVYSDLRTAAASGTLSDAELAALVRKSMGLAAA